MEPDENIANTGEKGGGLAQGGGRGERKGDWIRDIFEKVKLMGQEDYRV